jgi:curved DNA-binding protein CbpA
VPAILKLLTLSVDESMLLARVGQGATVAEIQQSSGVPERLLYAMLGRFLGQGALKIKSSPQGVVLSAPSMPTAPLRSESRPGPPPPPPSTGGNPAATSSAAIDLSAERQAEINALEAKLYKSTPFELLGVAAGATAADCKNAYYQLSMKFHPDRYYGKNLGPFKARIDRIFKKLTEAQAVVTDPDKRTQAQKDHPAWFGSVAPSDPSTGRDGLRAEDRARRLAKHPYLAKGARVHEALAKAKAAIAKDQPGQAINELQLLMRMEPDHAEGKTLLSQAQAKMAYQRSKQALTAGLAASDQGDHQKALPLLLEAMLASATALACEKGLSSALHVGDLKAAKAFATKWVELEPKSGRVRVAYGEVLEKVGMHKNAKREAEEALKLEPDNKAAKALLSKVRFA